jgi:predicted flap endonuclease-1-like 5' DNA nuclease
VIQIVKKKEVEPSNPHAREAYLAEGKERYPSRTQNFTLPTAIPNQPIAPIPLPNPAPTENLPSVKNELLTIGGINKKTASQLEELGINNIDDLAKASAENIAKDLKFDVSTVQKWISTAKKLQ